MLIIDGTIGSDISAFLARLNEETLSCEIVLYEKWLAEQTLHLRKSLSDNSNSARPECFFVFKKMYRRMRNKKNIKKNLFYIASFDTFYYVTLRKTLRTSGGNNHFSSFRISSNSDNNPQGVIYMRVMPEIALRRLESCSAKASKDKGPSNLTLEYIQQVYQQKNEQFIENKNNPTELQNLPVLVLNGNIDFQTDFSQFYSHLFYIKKFLLQIQERQEIALGIYKEKVHRRCC
ncbi:MAG TPA: hypothetical protein VHX42_03440 [Candidatus Babeliales bacterium]|jgi:hypothetical protein|nr:hypothetical protein [Candidatus Babeliales bacterium]